MLDRLTNFFHDASPAEARVTFKLPDSPEFAGCRLSGRITGPYCEYAQTLTATTPLAGGLTAQAVVLDPCFWTPESPYLYRASLELRRGAETLAVAEREFGIRTWDRYKNGFRFAGKSWVLRAVRREQPAADDLHACRANDAALWTTAPSDAICAQASRQGTLLVAEFDGTPAACLQEAARLSRHASAGMLVVSPALWEHFQDDEEMIDWTSRRWLASINLLLAERLDPAGEACPHPGAQVGVIRGGDAAAFRHFRQIDPPLPLIVVSNDPPPDDIAAGRAACDRLQRELADFGQFAGYVA